MNDETLEQAQAELSAAVGEALERCVAELGFTPPLCIAVLSKNGYAIAIRVSGDGAEPEVLAEPAAPPSAVLFPINMMVVDSSGTNAARFLIEGKASKGPRLRLVN